MRMYDTFRTISASVRSAFAWPLGDRDPSLSLDEPRDRETDRLLERMSLEELADLPLGREPRFIDPEALDLSQRLTSGNLRSTAVRLN